MCQAAAAAAAQKAAVGNRDMEAAGVRPLFPQTVGLTQQDGPALPVTRQEAAETMDRPKARG